jgi:hypothetical protein
MKRLALVAAAVRRTRYVSQAISIPANRPNATRA